MKVSKEDNNYIYYWVSKNIKKQRKNKGWTQKQLAEKCCFSENFIGDLENDTFKTCSLNTLYHISKVLGVPIKVLFEELEEETKKKNRCIKGVCKKHTLLFCLKLAYYLIDLIKHYLLLPKK